MVQPILIERIKVAQKEDSGIVRLVKEVQKGDKSKFNVLNDGVLRSKGRLCVPDNDEKKRIILNQAHRSLYIVYPRSINMYWDLRRHFWWNGIRSYPDQKYRT